MSDMTVPVNGDWSAQTLSPYGDLELCGFDLGVEFQETIPEIFQENTDMSGLSPEFLPYPSQDSVDMMPLTNVSRTELCDISNSQHHSVSPFDGYQVSGVPSSSTSPVEFDTWSSETNVHCGIPGFEQQQFHGMNITKGRKRKACDDVFVANSANDVIGECFQFGVIPAKELNAAGKPKRKRVQNARQRKAANVRERKRMFHLNEAFDSLKTRVPTFSDEKRLSRIETLKLAITYISFMSQLLAGKKPNEISLKSSLDGRSFSLDDLQNLKDSVSATYFSDGTDSSDSGSSSL